MVGRRTAGEPLPGKIRKGGNMVYNFSERKELNEKVEKELFRMKKVYQETEMSDMQGRDCGRKWRRRRR